MSSDYFDRLTLLRTGSQLDHFTIWLLEGLDRSQLGSTQKGLMSLSELQAARVDVIKVVL